MFHTYNLVYFDFWFVNTSYLNVCSTTILLIMLLVPVTLVRALVVRDYNNYTWGGVTASLKCNTRCYAPPPPGLPLFFVELRFKRGGVTTSEYSIIIIMYTHVNEWTNECTHAQLYKTRTRWHAGMHTHTHARTHAHLHARTHAYACNENVTMNTHQVREGSCNNTVQDARSCSCQPPVSPLLLGLP